jgi:hypothetical protein
MDPHHNRPPQHDIWQINVTDSQKYAGAGATPCRSYPCRLFSDCKTRVRKAVKDLHYRYDITKNMQAAQRPHAYFFKKRHKQRIIHYY